MAKREILSLMDLPMKTEEVVFDSENSLRVRGLSMKEITLLLKRFPTMAGFFAGVGFDPTQMVDLGPEIVGALCASAMGELGNEEAEARAATIPIGLQMDILEAMGRCTFSNGFGPFATRVATIARVLFVQGGKATDTNLPAPSSTSEEQPTPPSGT